MPRPKVDPSKRRRVAEACTYCRASKRRCSAVLPCTNCVERGRATYCTAEKTEEAHPAIPSQQRDSLQEAREERLESTDSPSHSDLAAANGRSPIVEHRTRPQMLRDSQGERGKLLIAAGLSSSVLTDGHDEPVFIGSSASLSFLRFIREAVAQHLGPCEFSDDTHGGDGQGGNMFEDTLPPSPRPPQIEDLGIEKVTEFVDVYLCAVWMVLVKYLPIRL